MTRIITFTRVANYGSVAFRRRIALGTRILLGITMITVVWFADVSERIVIAPALPLICHAERILGGMCMQSNWVTGLGTMHARS